MDCKDAIRKAVWQHYDGAHLDGDCLAKVIQEFGYKRTAWVLANTIQQLEWGGQYSSENKEWASRIYIPPDNGPRTLYYEHYEISVKFAVHR